MILQKAKLSKILTKLGQIGIVRAGLLSVSLMLTPGATLALEQYTPFKQALAEAVSYSPQVAAYYKENKFEAIWIGGPKENARLRALIDTITVADRHALPVARYNLQGLLDMLASVRSPQDMASAEARLTKIYLTLAQDMQTGVLVPSSIDEHIKRKVEVRTADEHLQGITTSDPAKYLRSLAPNTGEYTRLMKEKLRLASVIKNGGWGTPLSTKPVKPGAEGTRVVELRNRLMKMGFLQRSVSQRYDAKLENAVRDFQEAHGLEPDGVAGEGTLKEINVSPQQRLRSVVVAMERERWLNMPEGRGERHILVNLTDFSARVLDNDVETFRTRSVIGKNTSDRQSPEFSDEMEHMVINPTWHVPRSIAVKEYLPRLQRNPAALGHLTLVDRRGYVVDRASADFTQFTPRTFPYSIKQRPSKRNALGLVKFMFPNRYNIYLHDTPEKHLFSRETRAFSHGCIRLQQPFEFAYHLLAAQEDDPKDFFQRTLATRKEAYVNLEKHVPVHIIYRTVFTTAKGEVHFRRDVYGRDAKIWNALQDAGVSLPDVRG
ncbi:MAG: L,D-transpeptidase family protein [Pseudomonadota bacterium]